ncbi:hypothetical protein AB0K68_25000 [Streptomyces sp. NPDC050698]
MGPRHPAAARRPLTTPGDAIDTLAFGSDSATLHADSVHVALQTNTVDESKAATVCTRTRQIELTRTQCQTCLPYLPYRRICGE